MEHKAEHQHSGVYADPAEAKVIKGQGTADPADKAQGDTDAIDRINHADSSCAENCKRIDKSVAADKIVAQSQNDQHDRNGINGIENGHRNAEDGVKTLVADGKGKERDAQNKFIVADAFKQG